MAFFKTKRQVNRIIAGVPDFEKQARRFTKTKLQGGKKYHGC